MRFLKRGEVVIQTVDPKLKESTRVEDGRLACSEHPCSCGFSSLWGGTGIILCDGVYMGRKDENGGWAPTCPNS